MWAEAALLSVFVVAGNTLLRPLVNHINRLPVDTQPIETRYRIHVVASHHNVAEARDMLDEIAATVGLPILEVEALSETETQVELAAVLAPSSVDPAVLDGVAAELEKGPHITAPPGQSAQCLDG